MGGESKKRRLGSGQACVGCRGRKSRCDGRRPSCFNCQIRGISCDYADAHEGFSPEGETIPPPPEWWARPTTRDNRRTAMPFTVHQHEGRGSQTAVCRSSAEQSPSQTRFDQGETLAEKAPEPAVATVPDDNQVNAYLGSASMFSFVSSVSSAEPALPQHSYVKARATRASANQPAVTSDSSFFTSTGDSYAELPERQLADDLVDAYFSQVHPVYPFLHEGYFRGEYEKMWGKSPQQILRLTPSWFGVLNAVFTHGCEFCGSIAKEKRHRAAKAFFARAKSAALSEMFKPGSLETVQSLLMICYYLQGSADFSGCWYWVGITARMAISIGLHLNPSKASYTSLERELRKRLWWACVVIDHNLSLRIGRPPSLITKRSEVDLPLEVDDQYILNDDTEPRQPSRTPSMFSFLTCTISLSLIASMILEQLYLDSQTAELIDPKASSITAPSKQSQMLSKIVLLDGQLQSFWDSVPAHLREESAQPGHRIFKQQRIILQIRYLNIRLLLHRQAFLVFILGQAESSFFNVMLKESAQICMQCASEIISSIMGHIADHNLVSTSFSTYYLFTALCIFAVERRMRREDCLIPKAANSPAPNEQESAGMNHLREMSPLHPVATRYTSFLQNLVDKNREYPETATLGRPNANESDSRIEYGNDKLRAYQPLNELKMDRNIFWLGGGEGAYNDLDYFQLTDDFSSTGGEGFKDWESLGFPMMQ